MIHRNLILALALTLGINVAAPSPAQAGKTKISYFSELQSVKEALGLVRKQYVTEEKARDEALVYGAIEGLLKKLDDPYTRFMAPRAFDEMQTETQGRFGGLGILIGVKNAILTVISPIEGTPAYRIGVQAGDQILKVNGASTKGMTVSDAVKLLRGEIGTKVIISVRRKGKKGLIDYEITRGDIKTSSVKVRMIDDRIVYASISQFTQSSAQDLEKELSRLEDRYDIGGVVLDLRNNPGGLLNAAVEVSKIFLDRGRIVSIKGRRGDEVTYSSFTRKHEPWPLVVLINEGSASASEIVAGAIRDNKRGLLLGQKSFGKGSVQTVLPLADGSALALTTAYYYTPSGVCIHKKGIEPDIHVELPELDEESLKDFRAQREREMERTIRESQQGIKDSFMNVSQYDTQLSQAVDILKAATIFKNRVLAPATAPTHPAVALER